MNEAKIKEYGTVTEYVNIVVDVTWQCPYCDHNNGGYQGIRQYDYLVCRNCQRECKAGNGTD